MAIIPSTDKLFMHSEDVNTTIGGPESAQQASHWYTMQDVIDTVGGGGGGTYQVFTALLSQTGESNWINQTSGTFTVGVTYKFDTYNGIDDFSNIGGPPAAPYGTWDGYSFIATGTTPLVYTNSSSIDHNLGAPKAIILENTIGDFYFTYDDFGKFSCHSNVTFDIYKTFVTIANSNSFSGGGIGIADTDVLTNSVQIATWNAEFIPAVDNLFFTPFEIRVYN